MSTTPKQLSEPLNSTRSNPYISTGINKNLLSRCPRVGLSRKRTPKTPTQLLGATPPINVETTPLTSKIETSNSQPKEASSRIDKKKVSKCLLQDDNYKIPADGTKATKNKENSMSSTLVVDENNLNVTSSIDAKQESAELEIEELKPVEVLEEDRKLVNTDKLEIAKQEDNCAKPKRKGKKSPKVDDEMILETESRVSTTRVKKRTRRFLSENEIDVESQVSTTSSETISPSQINTSPLKPKNEATTSTKSTYSPELKVLKTDNKPPKTYRKPQKLKRSLSLKKTLSNRTDDEEFDDLLMQDCLVSLSPLEAANVSDFHSDIDTLQRQVMEKRKLLDELKRAEIYQKKHDVAELNELTGKYKQGCIEALRDLQKHTKTNTATLLNNLGIPKDLISSLEVD